MSQVCCDWQVVDTQAVWISDVTHGENVRRSHLCPKVHHVLKWGAEVTEIRPGMTSEVINLT